jgi:uncharacterized protein YqjF (DUF2071 family)
MDRLAPTRRPHAQAQGSQRWHRLLFSHWEVPELALRPLVPSGLALDHFDGRYFVGVVAFTMQKVRPYAWAPSIPTATDFGEINLRTYVHLAGEEPGVYFFSLDASSTLAVWAARTLWGLPYYRANITASETHNLTYQARRRQSDMSFEARACVGTARPAADPASLEFFLCERYQFYAHRGGRLRRARVHHTPYPLHAVEDATVSADLLRVAGLPTGGARTADWFSPGVDVEVFALEDV